MSVPSTCSDEVYIITPGILGELQRLSNDLKLEQPNSAKAQAIDSRINEIAKNRLPHEFIEMRDSVKKIHEGMERTEQSLKKLKTPLWESLIRSIGSVVKGFVRDIPGAKGWTVLGVECTVWSIKGSIFAVEKAPSVYLYIFHKNVKKDYPNLTDEQIIEMFFDLPTYDRAAYIALDLFATTPFLARKSVEALIADKIKKTQ